MMSETYNTTHDYATLFATLTNQNVFLTGKAGTGKTTFLHRLRETSQKQMAVAAPTGVAAINAGGATIHSLFQLPIAPFIPTESGRKELISKQKLHSNKRKVLRELELLVIDEISMVRADVLDAIDTVLRHVRYRFREPFGGVQVIFIGDMHQLSPVVQPEEWTLLSPYYKSAYFFNSQVYQEKPFVYIEFDKVFRQKDLRFVHLLNEVRHNRLSNDGKRLLESRYNPNFEPPADDTYIVLTTHNYKADRINADELNKIQSETRIFEATVSGDFPQKSFPCEERLELKIGAKVMFVKNDNETPRRFFNGKIGVITSWSRSTITVKCPGDAEEIVVNPMEWKNIRYQTDETSLQITEEELGAFVQFPLRLAWAITIHKSQGLTFDKVIVDAGATFAPGQVYVALSRCRTQEGLVLLSKIYEEAIHNDHEIVEFALRQFSKEQLEEHFRAAHSDYYLSLLLQVFNFEQLVTTMEKWLDMASDSVAAFGNETVDFLRQLKEEITRIHDVAIRFGLQIKQLVLTAPFNEDALKLRLEAAEGYFSEKLEQLIEVLKQSPATTDSRERAKEYDDFFETIHTLLELKKHLIYGVRDGFGIEKYFHIRNTFSLPQFSKSAYSRAQKRVKVQSRHPELMNILFELRNRIMDDTGLPIYLIAGSKTILEMADYLPQTKSDLLHISGFGEAKTEKFGEQFLELIREYCAENELDSSMNELLELQKRERKTHKEKKEKKEKKDEKPKRRKGDSVFETLQAYEKGLSIAEIAQSRNLSEGTIAGHLAELVQQGRFDTEHFVDRETLLQAKALIENAHYDGTVWGFLKERFPVSQLPFIMAWLRRETN